MIDFFLWSLHSMCQPIKDVLCIIRKYVIGVIEPLTRLGGVTSFRLLTEKS